MVGVRIAFDEVPDRSELDVEKTSIVATKVKQRVHRRVLRRNHGITGLPRREVDGAPPLYVRYVQVAQAVGLRSCRRGVWFISFARAPQGRPEYRWWLVPSGARWKQFRYHHAVKRKIRAASRGRDLRGYALPTRVGYKQFCLCDAVRACSISSVTMREDPIRVPKMWLLVSWASRIH